MMSMTLSPGGQNLLGMMSSYMLSGDVSRGDVERQFEVLRAIPFPNLDPVGDGEAAWIRQMLIERHGVSVAEGSAVSTAFEPWYDDERRAATDWYYWQRYRQHLSPKLPPTALQALDRTTDKILERCVDPLGLGEADRRGMGLGDVQSGKTANYTGLVCKAADLGYRVFIIVAGIHENLRSQTQDRIDLGFTGWRSAGPVNGVQLYGVGRIDPKHRATNFTTSASDFRKNAAKSLGVPLRNLQQPVVFVVKKNPKVLATLIEWLAAENRKAGVERIAEPMLLIDDEADNASINIAKGRDEVSKINGHLRKLLTLFERRTYCAYTATPFANIFIEPRQAHEEFGADIFPEHFLVTLDLPDNYFGAAKVFREAEDEASPVRIIADRDPHLPERLPKRLRITSLPNSLADAVRAFLLVKAIRLQRGQVDEHHSMLVNVSHLTAVQTQVRNLVAVLLEQVRSAIVVHAHLPEAEALADPEMAALLRVFDEEFADCGASWDEVQPLLDLSVAGCTVKAENSASSDRLDYKAHPKGLTVVGVGGFALGRGLTLEGLSVSYILRNTKMYDTLLQMARWFGYRPGYEDLCRVWMTDESRKWYAHIAEANDELRAEIRRMEREGKAPEDFGLKVRTHPDALEITARAKLGTSREVVVDVDLVGAVVDTSVVHVDPASQAEANRQAVIRLATTLAAGGMTQEGIGTSTGRLFPRAPLSVVRDFLSRWANHPRSGLTDTGPLLQYIYDRENEMGEWDVAFVGLGAGEDGLRWDGLGFQLVCQRRQTRDASGKILLADRQWEAQSRRFSTRGVARIGMELGEIAAAEAWFRSEFPAKRNVSDKAYALHRTRPLLAVNMIAPSDVSPPWEVPVSTWTLALPSSSRKGQTVSYRVNTVWMNEYDEVDEDERDYDEA